MISIKYKFGNNGLDDMTVARKQASRQFFLMQAGYMGSYTANLGLRHYGLSPQSCL